MTRSAKNVFAAESPPEMHRGQSGQCGSTSRVGRFATDAVHIRRCWPRGRSGRCFGVLAEQTRFSRTVPVSTSACHACIAYGIFSGKERQRSYSTGSSWRLTALQSLPRSRGKVFALRGWATSIEDCANFGRPAWHSLCPHTSGILWWKRTIWRVTSPTLPP